MRAVVWKPGFRACFRSGSGKLSVVLLYAFHAELILLPPVSASRQRMCEPISICVKINLPSIYRTLRSRSPPHRTCLKRMETVSVSWRQRASKQLQYHPHIHPSPTTPDLNVHPYSYPFSRKRGSFQWEDARIREIKDGVIFQEMFNRVKYYMYLSVLIRVFIMSNHRAGVGCFYLWYDVHQKCVEFDQ